MTPVCLSARKAPCLIDTRCGGTGNPLCLVDYLGRYCAGVMPFPNQRVRLFAQKRPTKNVLRSGEAPEKLGPGSRGERVTFKTDERAVEAGQGYNTCPTQLRREVATPTTVTKSILRAPGEYQRFCASLTFPSREKIAL